MLKSVIQPTPKINVAIEGCCHGELDKIYKAISDMEQREGQKVHYMINLENI
jgi:hypothetical protein